MVKAPPRNPRLQQINFRLGSAEHKRLIRAAKDESRTVASFVRQAVAEKIDRQKRLLELQNQVDAELEAQPDA